MPVVLTIAGSDPSGGAGLQADLRTFESFDVRGLSAVTAITAQNEETVFGVHAVEADVLTQQLAAVMRGQKINAVKIGMIGSVANVMAIILFLHSANIPHVIIDPVLSSTSGEPLLETRALNIFKNQLLPLATLITPNTDEAGVLSGMRIWNLGTSKDAARQIYNETYQLKKEIFRIPPLEKGGEGGFKLAVLVKGGHLAGEPVDILYNGNDFIEFPSKRINATKHGTGCVLSSAIAAGLANDKDLPAAIAEAKKFVENYIRTGPGR